MLRLGEEKGPPKAFPRFLPGWPQPEAGPWRGSLGATGAGGRGLSAAASSGSFRDMGRMGVNLADGRLALRRAAEERNGPLVGHGPRRGSGGLFLPRDAEARLARPAVRAAGCWRRPPSRPSPHPLRAAVCWGGLTDWD